MFGRERLMHEELNVEALVESARAGDREAFAALSSHHHESLLKIVKARLGAHKVGALEAEDIVQETFVRALEGLDRFQWTGEDSFLRWLAGVARRVVLSSSRRNRRDRPLEVAGDPIAEAVSPSRALRREDRLARLESVLHGLSPAHRDVIILAQIDGLTSVEIAARTGRSPEAVRRLLWRALRKLKSGFGETESFHLPERGIDRKADD